MADPLQVLRDARSILVIDWPSRDVPDSLARAGFEVTVSGGPEPDNFSRYEPAGDEVVARRTGRPPAQADLVYSHRPLDELPDIIAAARSVGASTVWVQSGRAADGSRDPTGCWLSDEDSDAARRHVEAADLGYLDRAYIADVARSLGERR